MRHFQFKITSLLLIFCLIAGTTAAVPFDSPAKLLLPICCNIFSTEALQLPHAAFRDVDSPGHDISAKIDALTTAYFVYKMALHIGNKDGVKQTMEELYQIWPEKVGDDHKYALDRSVKNVISNAYVGFFHGPVLEPLAFLLIDREANNPIFLWQIILNPTLGTYVRLYALGVRAIRSNANDDPPSDLMKAVHALLKETKTGKINEFFEKLLLPQPLMAAMETVSKIAVLLDETAGNSGKKERNDEIKAIMEAQAAFKGWTAEPPQFRSAA